MGWSYTCIYSLTRGLLCSFHLGMLRTEWRNTTPSVSASISSPQEMEECISDYAISPLPLHQQFFAFMLCFKTAMHSNRYGRGGTPRGSQRIISDWYWARQSYSGSAQLTHQCRNESWFLSFPFPLRVNTLQHQQNVSSSIIILPSRQPLSTELSVIKLLEFGLFHWLLSPTV